MLSYRLLRNTLLILCLNFISLAAISENNKQIIIAVQSFLGPDIATKKWQPMIDSLNHKFNYYDFKLSIIEATNTSLLQELVSENKLDYVITQQVATAELEKLSGIVPLLTKVDKLGVSQFGSVIFTLASNTNTNSSSDLKGKSFAGANPVGLGGWILGYDYLLKQAVDPYSDFSRIDFLGRQDNIVKAVSQQLVHAGLVRTGVLEKMNKNGAIKLSDFKILDLKPEFPYLLSTHLVPEWSFSANKNTNLELSEKIVRFFMSPNYFRNGGTFVDLPLWGKVADYKTIHRLLKKHKLSIYQDPFYLKFYRENSIAIIITIVLSAYLFQVIRNRKKIEIQQYKMQLEQLSRVNSVDRLLSEVTHELAQPITSIKIDAHILSKMLKDEDKCDFDQVRATSHELQLKTDHCVDLLTNIRSFLSNKKITKEKFIANKNIIKITKMLKQDLARNDIYLELFLDDNLKSIEMSSIELDQVLLNLVKNSINAMVDNAKQVNSLSIRSTFSHNKISILIIDTGGKINNIDNLFVLFKSSKEKTDTEGLGIGLNLSRRIIRSYGGTLTLNSTSNKGSSFLITLPMVT
jgi:two-component system sensor histidine kinase TtrS